MESKLLDPEMKINLAALRKCDEFVLDILETSSQVAVYKFDPTKKGWEKTEVEGSLFLYQRSTLPKFALMIMNRLNRNNLNVYIAREMEFKVQKPFLLYKNSSMDIQGIWFNNPEKCEKVGKLITRLYTSPILQEATAKLPKQMTEKKDEDKNILTMFAEAQKKYNHENKVPTATNGPSSKTQVKRKPISKIRSKSLSCQQPPSSIVLLPAPVKNEDENRLHTLEHDPCIVRSSPLRPAPAPSQTESILSKSLPNSAKKTPQRQLFTQEPTPFPSQLPTEKVPFPSIPLQGRISPLKSGNGKSGLSNQKSGNDITLAASLMSPFAFQSPLAFQSPKTVSNNLTETTTLTKEQLQETLLYLLERDSDFLEKIHSTYVKNVSS